MDTERIPDPRIQATITVDEAAAIYGVSRGAAYAAVNNGDIPSIRVGRRFLIPTAAVRKQLGLDPDPAA